MSNPLDGFVSLDIETSPYLIWAWDTREVNAAAVEQETFMLNFGYKKLSESSIRKVSLWDFKARYKADPTDDTDVLLALWHILDEAEVVNAHNGDQFDIKRAAAYMDRKLSSVVKDYAPPSPFRALDTLKEYRKHYNLRSYKLDYIGEYFGFGRKVRHPGISLWLDAMKGNKGAQELMDEYVKGDIKLQEDAYLFIRPRIKNHPNMATLADMPDACPKCLSTNIVCNGKDYIKNNTYWYQRYQCSKCKAPLRGRHREVENDKGEELHKSELMVA